MCPPFLNFTERSASANCSALARTDLFRSVYSSSLTSEVFLQLKSDYLVMVVTQPFGSQSLVLGSDSRLPFGLALLAMMNIVFSDTRVPCSAACTAASMSMPRSAQFIACEVEGDFPITPALVS